MSVNEGKSAARRVVRSGAATGAAPENPASGRAAPPGCPPARPPDARNRDAHGSSAGDAGGSDATVRLSKRMSELGLCSRREADEWIARGWVSVHGAVVKELGTKVVPTLPARAISISRAASGEQAQRVTVLIHKPLGYVSGQAEDGYQPAVVLVTPPNRWKGDDSPMQFRREQLKSLVPAGRLDIDSTGLLVLTQDGRIAKQLIGEDSDVEKEYLVRVAAGAGGRVKEALSRAKLALLNHGLHMDGKPLKPAKVAWAYPQQPDDDQLRFVLKEGKKRQIRRMVEAVGLRVVALKRVRIGGVQLGNLPVGTWRYLKDGETF